MTGPDIRWQQRFGNYRRALMRLAEAVELSRQRNLSTHTYNEAAVQEIVAAVVNSHLSAFQQLETPLHDLEPQP